MRKMEKDNSKEMVRKEDNDINDIYDIMILMTLMIFLKATGNYILCSLKATYNMYKCMCMYICLY